MHRSLSALITALAALVAGATISSCSGDSATPSSTPVTETTSIPTTTVPTSTNPSMSTDIDTMTRPGPSTTVHVAGPVLERVLTVGDGVMFDLEPAVAAALAPAVVRPRAYFGSGLSNPDHYNWAARWPEELAADGGAQLVVVLLGVWDARDVETTIAGDLVAVPLGTLPPETVSPETVPPETVSPKTLSPGSGPWRAWYRGRVEHAARILASDGAAVLWVLPLAEPDPLKAQRLAAVESVITEVVSGLDRQGVVDGDIALSGAANRYTQSTPDGATLRKNDGEHLCPAGATVLADAVASFATRWFSIAANTGWEQGVWRDDPRYHDPSEGCGP